MVFIVLRSQLRSEERHQPFDIAGTSTFENYFHSSRGRSNTFHKNRRKDVAALSNLPAHCMLGKSN
jgi:hypothetical protein